LVRQNSIAFRKEEVIAALSISVALIGIESEIASSK
jgi:hypothetical protein